MLKKRVQSEPRHLNGSKAFVNLKIYMKHLFSTVYTLPIIGSRRSRPRPKKFQINSNMLRVDIRDSEAIFVA